MTFNPAIPQPGDIISQSQKQLLTNNTALDNTFGVDHYKFSATTNAGSHQQISFPLNPTPPAVPTDPASFLYTNQAGPSGSQVSQLFFENAKGIQQLTGDVSAISNGYTTLPGGIIFQWGIGIANTSGASISFPVPFTAACFSVVATVLNSGSTPRYVSEVTAASLVGFTAISTNTLQIYWMALGK